MLRTFIYLTALVVLSLLGFPAKAAQFGTRDEAVAMVKRVQEKFKKDGAQATFAAITAQTKAFHDRDLYVYVLNYDCVIQAHTAPKNLMRKTLYPFPDQYVTYPSRNTIYHA